MFKKLLKLLLCLVIVVIIVIIVDLNVYKSKLGFASKISITKEHPDNLYLVKKKIGGYYISIIPVTPKIVKERIFYDESYRSKIDSILSPYFSKIYSENDSKDYFNCLTSVLSLREQLSKESIHSEIIVENKLHVFLKIHVKTDKKTKFIKLDLVKGILKEE